MACRYLNRKSCMIRVGVLVGRNLTRSLNLSAPCSSRLPHLRGNFYLSPSSSHSSREEVHLLSRRSALVFYSSMSDSPTTTSTRSASTTTNRVDGTRDEAGTGVEGRDSMSQDETTMQHARHIFSRAVDSVLPHEMIKSHLQFDQNSHMLTIAGQSYHLDHNVHVVGFGKAVLGMVRAVEDTLGQHIVRGVVSVPVGARQALRDNGKLDMIPRLDFRVKVREGAANNLPDEEACNAAVEIKRIAESVQEGDILLVLMSGGGSALLTVPHDPLSLTDMIQVSKEMAKAGADIKQLNYMRKQLEVLKGGGLATLAYPAKIISLILSDVIGDPIDLIASGPTVPDTATTKGCLSLLSQLGIEGNIPKSVTDFLKDDVNNRQASRSTQQEPAGRSDTEHQEPPAVDVWTNVQNVIIGSNTLACESASIMSKEFGYLPYILSTDLDGEARVVGAAFAALAFYVSMCMNPSRNTSSELTSLRSELVHDFHFKAKQLDDITNLVTSLKDDENKINIAIIAGGETTVTVRGRGRGGRNQEMALAAGLELNKRFSDVLKKTVHNSVSQVKDTIGQKQPDDDFTDSSSSSSSSSCGNDNNITNRPVSVVFLSGGTDGQDGPTPAAGGVVSLDFASQSEASGLDARRHLEENDSYNLLKVVKEGCYLLETGLTGTNVMDINLLLVRDVS